MSDSEMICVSMQGAETTVSFSPDHINRTETAQKISWDLCELIEDTQSGETPLDHIVLDFRGIDRIGSAGLNGLIGIKSKARSHGVRVVLSNVQESVRDVFALTRLERMFEFRTVDGRGVTFG
ncbi:STAS domain-containing protein [Rubripirellula reticaptiva]|uniref:STAS domain protein n=1 Tax=Rubripirellula reticaptiva TaxID=2528013 RepID=A0A5C6ENQ6_9BACT|nr:STAS domain-containing protein [Rubripirellula reticaptiva]TWU49677.1 STAS domain protein [Rubripirellula reticaptiva]